MDTLRQYGMPVRLKPEEFGIEEKQLGINANSVLLQSDQFIADENAIEFFSASPQLHTGQFFIEDTQVENLQVENRPASAQFPQQQCITVRTQVEKERSSPMLLGGNPNGASLGVTQISSEKGLRGEDGNAAGNNVPDPSVQQFNICSTCKKKFRRLYNLKVHLRKHTGETPYKCPYETCDLKFKWRSSMGHHVRAFHKGTNADIISNRSKKMAPTTGASLNSIQYRKGSKVNFSQASDSTQTPVQPACKSTTGKRKTPSKPSRKSTKRKLFTREKKVVPKAKKRKAAVVADSTGDKSIASVAKASISEDGVNNQESMIDSNGNTLDHLFEEFDNMENFPFETLTPEPMGDEQGNQGDNNPMLNIVSDILTREDILQGVEGLYGPGSVEDVGKGGLYEHGGVADVGEQVSEDGLNSGMIFLAVGSDNATNAEMDYLANSDGMLSSHSNAGESPHIGRVNLLPSSVLDFQSS